MNQYQHITEQAGEFAGFASKICESWLGWPLDKQTLGPCLYPSDARGDTIQQKETYAWYGAISEVLQPKLIGEIGVRYGYTLYTMALASNACEAAIGFDNQSYISDSSEWAKRHISKICDVSIVELDTQKADKLPAKGFDIIHVDGDHTSQGCYHDLKLAYDATEVGGWILVDDIKGLYYHTAQDDAVKSGADRFLRETGLKHFFLPTFRGLYLIQR